jgi:EAL domain-containing protein (putative c-di-GMP-specific phosphodiesterase class I)
MTMTERRQPAAKPRIVRRLADLESAMARDEIEVLFQPQVDIATGTPVGVEALARWQHPDLGELGPERLFDIAARSGTIAALSRHIQDRALTLAGQWQEPLSDLRLSVNVTSQDIAEQGFADDKLARLHSTGFPADRLTLEITEAGLIADLHRAAQVLQGLREQGLHIAIDDFGTGYSSLAYLKALPVDTLKLDRAFTQDIAGSAKARIIVGSVIQMARELGLTVIAEGVETAEQQALLAERGVTLCQGFLFAPPLSSAALADWSAR